MNKTDGDGNEIRIGDRVEFLTRDGGNVDGRVIGIGPKKVKVEWIECGITVSRSFYPEALLKLSAYQLAMVEFNATNANRKA